MRQIHWALIVSMSLLTATGCQGPIEDRVEKKIEGVLPEYIGPADTYSVSVNGKSVGAMMRGHIQNVHIEGSNVHIESNLTVQRLILDLDEVSVNTKTKRLNNISRATFECHIASNDLDTYARQRRKDIPGLSISLKDGSIICKAKPDAFGIANKFGFDFQGQLNVPITVRGFLNPVDPTHLDFVPEEARVSILPVSKIALEMLAKRINPVVDLSKLRMPLQIERTVVDGDSLVISGSIRPNDLLERQQQ